MRRHSGFFLVSETIKEALFHLALPPGELSPKVTERVSFIHRSFFTIGIFLAIKVTAKQSSASRTVNPVTLSAG